MNLDVKEKLEALILDVPNFPKEGIMFKDITPLLAEPGAINEVATQMASAFEGKNINYVAGLEARGFIIRSISSKYSKCWLYPNQKIWQITEGNA